jgi:hypothetical protein
LDHSIKLRGANFFCEGFEQEEQGILTADARGWTMIRQGVTEAWFSMAWLLRFVGGVWVDSEDCWKNSEIVLL